VAETALAASEELVVLVDEHGKEIGTAGVADPPRTERQLADRIDGFANRTSEIADALLRVRERVD
jgi:hypothetical protein